MEKQIKISSDQKAATITITVPFRGNNIAKEKYQTVEAIAMIEETGYTVESVVQAAMVTNCSPDKLTGTWIFLLKEKKQEKKELEPATNVIIAPPINFEVESKKLKTKKVRDSD